MNRNFLKGLLGENATKEVIDEIMAENGKDIEAEKGKYAELKAQLDNANKTITERDQQLEALKAHDPSELKQQIEALQQQNEQAKAQHAKEMHDLQVKTALEKALSNAKSKNNKAVQALLDLGEAELNEDGTIKGLEDKLKELQKTDAYLFDTETAIKGTKPANEAGNTDPSKNSKPSTYEDFLKQVEAENK